MNRWLRTGVLFTTLSVTGMIGYHINWTSYNAVQKPHDVTEIFIKDVNDCSLERVVGLFYDKHLQLPLRLERVMDAYYGGCVRYADSNAQRRMNEEYEVKMSIVRENYCQRYGAGEIEGDLRYDCG